MMRPETAATDEHEDDTSTPIAAFGCRASLLLMESSSFPSPFGPSWPSAEARQSQPRPTALDFERSPPTHERPHRRAVDAVRAAMKGGAAMILAGAIAA